MSNFIVTSCLFICILHCWKSCSVAMSSGLNAPNDNDRTRAEIFLKKYKYIQISNSGQTVQNDASIPVSPSALKAALRRFQQFAGLPVTGELDTRTLDLMSKPRCGIPDIENNYETAGSKYNKLILTYIVSRYSNVFSPISTDDNVTKALATWASVTPLTFRRVTSGPRDIDVQFLTGYHGDNTPFDGPGRTLAHANFPTDGRVHFDDDETWTTANYAAFSTNFFEVALHEFGHTLGLYHSPVRDSIMYPYYNESIRKLSLHPDDIAGIQSIYGACDSNLLVHYPNTRAVASTPRQSGGTRVSRLEVCQFMCLQRVNPECTSFDYQDNIAVEERCFLYLIPNEIIVLEENVNPSLGYNHYKRRFCATIPTTTSPPPTTTTQITSCAVGRLLCANRQRCIPNNWICDGDNDCGDLSDEQNCHSTTTYSYPTTTTFTTRSPTTTTIRSCLAGEFLCNNRQRCIPNRWICDRDNDCGDWSDESACSSSTSTTVSPSTSTIRSCPGQFRCNNRLRCIPNQWICDRDNDCGDWSDELGCTSSTSTSTRTTTTTGAPCNGFRCPNGVTCVLLTRVCDGRNDCGDFADETNCQRSSTSSLISSLIPSTSLCPFNYFQCRLYSQCIPNAWRCDNYNNCVDGSDELNCPAWWLATYPGSTPRSGPERLVPTTLPPNNG